MWLKNTTGVSLLWVAAAEAHAKGSFEAACESYRKALDMLPPGHDRDGPVMDFIVDKVTYSPTCTYCTCTCTENVRIPYFLIH